MESLEVWVQKKLSEILQFQVGREIFEHIVNIENEKDLEMYFHSLLDIRNPKHIEFIVECKKRRLSYNNQIGYKKVNDDNYNKPNKQNKKKKGKERGKENIQIQEVPRSEKVEKKKTKFTNLYSQGDIYLKGRHKCDCEGKRHNLINNCLNCGRIVCQQENSGPCFFCGQLVCSPEQQTILQAKTKESSHLYNQLMSQKQNKDLIDSLKQRDKLLEYDRNSARRTKVIDDESDYYQSSNIWLNPAEREKLGRQEAEASARKHMSRLNKKVTIDFMGRVVTEDNQLVNQFDNLYLEEPESYNNFENPNICPTIEFDRPTFVEMGILKTNKKAEYHLWNMESRIQDKEYLEMSDQGLCLSIQQPYASLLVAGIKTHESRAWYTSHRGRLWIASTAKQPSPDEISTLQHCYQTLKDEDIQFPETYPISCLLGCVTLTDVLSREEYRTQYPEGECESPYVFICENCYMLPVQLPGTRRMLR